ncbi:uncharacterized protein LOC117118116 [Anneissia japonica]|uniref:uncharacterized protein LOC117118116 n=1 Tax=Anneissia japonica TaxID=1529436 RepID=UPI001425A476|nr:uncharacterized protein LOC117118116 [Anneissia japonica]
MAKFNGRCIVLSEVKWDTPDLTPQCDAPHCFKIGAKSGGTCSFLIKSQGTACFASCVSIIFIIAKLVTKKEFKRSLQFLAVASLIYAILAFISAIILVVSLHKICNGLTEYFNTCENAQNPDVWKHWKDGEGGKNFIHLFKGAQTASWITCVSWFIVSITYVIKLLRSSQEIPLQRFENETNVVT